MARRRGAAVVVDRNVLLKWVSVTLFAFVSAPALATVTATVDRPTVDLNESFTLDIVVDSDTDQQPDLSVLEADFDVGQVDRLSNTTIYNGEIRRSLKWSVALRPRRTGQLTVPPIVVGGEQSDPLIVLVNEPTNAPPGEADVFVTSEVDLDETYVQAQILYRIRIYRAVATRQPALREPTISGAEALVELAGDERQYDAVLGGRSYNVVERVIALYPQKSGEIQISPARFEARVLRNGRITGRKVFESESHTINVLPIPAPPADYPDAAWLPARDVQLREEWSRPPDEMEAGEPVTRIISLSVLGQIETQLPSIDAPEVNGLNIYADKPELGRTLEADGIRGLRKDQYAIIGLAGGELELPAVNLPWWDIDEGRWQVATLPARTLTVAGAGPQQRVPPPAAAIPGETADRDSVPPAETASVPDGDSVLAVNVFWQRAAELLGVLWLLTIAAWWWSSRSAPRRARKPREPKEPPAHKLQAELLKTARKAAASGDGAAVRQAVLEWGRLQWPGGAPRSIGELAARVEAPLSDELSRLSSLSYGPGRGAFDGDALAAALKSVTVAVRHRDAAPGEILPPLMPPAT